MDYELMANKFMPELGYEIGDFKYNTWHVGNWQHLEKRITGPEFEVGGWKWRILLFPFGNKIRDIVSIYLDFVDPMGAPAGWQLYVQFALVLWNPEDPTQYIYFHSRHRFTAEKSDWGFKRFYNLNKLSAPYEFIQESFQNGKINRTRALIENGSTNITAFVRVFKGSTGVLCRDLDYVGLRKRSDTSYMNSLLQTLYCITYFRKSIYQILTEDDEPGTSIPLELQRVFYNLQVSDTPVKTTDLTISFGWDSLDFFTYNNVQEFNRVLQCNLEVKMKGTKVDGVFAKLFSGKMKHHFKCINVDYESSHIENYYDIQLNVKGCKTLRDSFKDYIRGEIYEGDNKYHIEDYGVQDAKRSVTFESFPPVLHLQLKRFKYDIQKDEMVKINDRFEYPMEINLEEFLSEDADKSNSHKYLLYGVFIHSGGFHGGHYFVLLKPEKDGKWIRFDDNYVRPITDNEVLENYYGGEVLNANQINTDNEMTNAYMLVYIRESNINEILSPVIPEDIPNYLQRRLEEEEKEEKHLYLTIKVVTIEKFKSNQGFGIAKFSDYLYPLHRAHEYKILKSETYGNFKENISQNFNILPERVRFWIFANRQNKTIRLDSLIPESYSNISMEVVHKRMNCRKNVVRLYMEVADKPIDDHIWFPKENNQDIIVFLKYFDPDKQVLEGLGHLYVKLSDKIGDYNQTFCEKKDFPLDTPLEIYEENRPDWIEKKNPDFTFKRSEIQNGDIICFQKALTKMEIQEHKTAGRYYDIPRFYKSLTLVRWN